MVALWIAALGNGLLLKHAASQPPPKQIPYCPALAPDGIAPCSAICSPEDPDCAERAFGTSNKHSEWQLGRLADHVTRAGRRFARSVAPGGTARNRLEDEQLGRLGRAVFMLLLTLHEFICTLRFATCFAGELFLQQLSELSDFISQALQEATLHKFGIYVSASSGDLPIVWEAISSNILLFTLNITDTLLQSSLLAGDNRQRLNFESGGPVLTEFFPPSYFPACAAALAEGSFPKVPWDTLVSALAPEGWVIDLGAAWIEDDDPVHALLRRPHYRAALFEGGPERFETLKDYETRRHTCVFLREVDPQEAVELFVNCVRTTDDAGIAAATDVALLKIDVDNGDCDFAARFLDAGFLPSVLIMEIRDRIPPPFKYSQPYEPGHGLHAPHIALSLRGVLNGCSVAAQTHLLQPFGYVLVQIDNLNAVFVHAAAANIGPRKGSPARARLVDVLGASGLRHIDPALGGELAWPSVHSVYQRDVLCNPQYQLEWQNWAYRADLRSWSDEAVPLSVRARRLEAHLRSSTRDGRLVGSLAWDDGDRWLERQQR